MSDRNDIITSGWGDVLRHDSTTAAADAYRFAGSRVDAAQAQVDEARNNPFDWDTYADASRALGAAQNDQRLVSNGITEQFGHNWTPPAEHTAEQGRAR